MMDEDTYDYLCQVQARITKLEENFVKLRKEVRDYVNKGTKPILSRQKPVNNI